MALLLDGPPSTIDDLTGRDSDLLNVAVAEGIDLTAKLQIAADDIGCKVETFLTGAMPSYDSSRQDFPGMRHIAITPQLKLWHTYSTLRLVYQDLYYSRLNDRYQAKMKLYREEEERTLDHLRTTGLGVVFDPIPQALVPNFTTIQTADTGGTVYVAVALVNQRGEEGLASTPMDVQTQDGTAVQVNLSTFPNDAIGWNLYAGTSADAITRQNSQILDPLASATVAPGRLTTGSTPGTGQRVNARCPIPRRILRG